MVKYAGTFVHVKIIITEENNYQDKLQKPIGPWFDKTSTAQEVINNVDPNWMIAIVTGGHSGLGLETTKTLAVAGA